MGRGKSCGLLTLRRRVGRFKPARRQFYRRFPLPLSLEREVIRLECELPFDAGGTCSLDKKHALASLIATRGLRRSVEIGVYRGSSLLPQALAQRHIGGHAIGIDPYSAECAHQEEGQDMMRLAMGDDFEEVCEAIDWDALYLEILSRIEQYGLAGSAEIIRKPSAEAVSGIEPGFDLVHIDGNHDSSAFAEDVRNYIPKLRVGGIAVIDDTEWSSIRPGYEKLKAGMRVLYEDWDWGVLEKTG
jgi:predicted O-methyltransferase YrrM